MWKYLKTTLAAATIIGGLSLGTAMAQDNAAPGNKVPSGVNATPAAGYNNNGGWGWGWGWIGLAGLIGLFGLMPRDDYSGPRELGPPRR